MATVLVLALICMVFGKTVLLLLALMLLSLPFVVNVFILVTCVAMAVAVKGGWLVLLVMFIASSVALNMRD
jgi:hypothetical protein